MKNTENSFEVNTIQNYLMRKELLIHKNAKTDLIRDIMELKSSMARVNSALRRKKIDKKSVLYMPIDEIYIIYGDQQDVLCVLLALFQVSTRHRNSTEHSDPETIANLKIITAATFFY